MQDIQIKVFKLMGRLFVLDLTTLSFFECDSRLADFIMKSQTGSVNIYNQKTLIDASLIDNLKNIGLIASPKPLTHARILPAYQFISQFRATLFRAHSRNIILHLSEHCNLRCSYCDIFSILSSRSSESAITLQLCDVRKAFRQISEQSPSASKWHILFAGGEPLLQIDLIRKIVEHLRINYPDLSLEFSLTTNGTLLNNQIIDWLVKNKFAITISIDGPSKIHDKSRKYINGKGSHKDVIGSIFRIAGSFPDYFDSSLRLNCVYHTAKDLQNCTEYFIAHKLYNVTFSPVVNNKCTRLIQEVRTCRRFINSNLINFINAVYSRDTQLVRFYGRNFMDHCISFLARKYIYSNKNNILVNQSCKPLIDNILIDCEGKISFCESIYSTYLCGSLQNGIDYAQIYSLYNAITEYNNEVCCNCWCKFLCSVCWINMIDKSGKVNTSLLKSKHCDGLPTIIKHTLELCVRLIDHDPDIIMHVYNLLIKE
ncbi:MAG: radical SAM protein [Calditrichaeota bacterium]|nr:radical SAM protein [Calditrichota bacterium]